MLITERALHKGLESVSCYCLRFSHQRADSSIVPLSVQAISKLWRECGETVRRRSVSFIASRRPVPSRRRSSRDSESNMGYWIAEELIRCGAVRCSKQDLSACVVDAAEDTERHFSGDDLRQLFRFNEKTVCDTHDTFKCKRCRDGKQLIKAPALLYGDASR